MIRASFLALTALAAAALPLRAADLPPDLAAVPDGAIGFLHVKVADLWKSDFLKDFRTSILKAGPQALKAFDERFVPAPSTIDRVTIIALMPGGGMNDPPFVAVVSCSEPFDPKKALNNLLPMGKEITVGDRTYVADEEVSLGVTIIDNKTLAVAPSDVMRQYLEMKPKSTNVFTPALKEAAGKRQILIALNSSLLPGEAVAELPEPLQPLARAKTVQVGVDIGKEIQVDARMQFGDEAQAKSGETAAREGLKMARDAIQGLKKQFTDQLMPSDKKGVAPISELPEAALALVALGAIEQLDEYLKDLPLKREGEALAASVTVPAGPYTSLLGLSGLSAGFALPAVAQFRIAATRSRSANNLKQIMLAYHSYHDVYGAMPAAAICDKNGKPLLSWRVAILPFIEQDNLYKQFRLDEPWDSEHNKKLIPLMPKVYVVPNTEKPGEHVTHYRVFYGNGAASELKRGVRLTDFTDGTSNTLVIVEATDPVVWTKPDELEYDATKPLPKLGKPMAEGFYVAMGDGSVRFIKKTVKETTLRGAITRNGGEVFNDFE